MKLLIRCLFVISFSLCNLYPSFGQYISLDGRQFKDENGENFYPMVMNYYIDLAYDSTVSNIPPYSFANTYLAQFIQIGSNGSYNYPNIADGPKRIKQDFYEIKNLGFNVVRLVMAPEKRALDSGFFFVVNNFQRWAYEGSFINVNIQPPYIPSSNAPLTFFFNKLMEVIEIADSLDLKIWIGCVNSGEAINGDLAIADYTDYLAALADFIHSHNMYNVFCYEFFGEPSFVEIYKPPPGFARHTKSQICEIANNWNTVMKLHDPDHLTTIGAIGIDDPKAWDPNLINVDFTNIHLYLEPKTFEWRTDNYPNGNDPDFLTHCIKRYKDKIYLFDEHIVKPYIISETSFPGEDPGEGSSFNDWIPYPRATYGDEADGAYFVSETFPLIKNAGASGYGWWEFQNKWWFGVPSDSNVRTLQEFMEDYFGLLRFGNPVPNDTNGYENDSIHLRKLAAHAFVNYISNPPPQTHPVYGPISQTFNMTDSYYNPFDHDTNFTVYNNLYGTITGKVKDQFGNPIEGAIITGISEIGQDMDLIGSDTTYYIYYAFTDKNGCFELRAYDYLPNSNGHPSDLTKKWDKTIVDLKISAYGSEWIERGWQGGQIQQNDTSYILHSLQTEFNKVIHDFIIPIGVTQNFQAYSSITTNNLSIEGNGVNGGHSDLAARNYIELRNEFFSAHGSEVHIFTEPIPTICDSITNFGIKNIENELNIYNKKSFSSNEVEITFLKSHSELQIKIYPNPSNGRFSIIISGCKEEIDAKTEFDIIDNIGNEIMHGCFYGRQVQIELNAVKPSVYFISLKSKSINLTKKLVII